MNLRLLPLLSLLAAASPASAGIIYSGPINAPIPVDFEGVYLRLDPELITPSFPGDWATAPWINPFFGGVAIGNSPLLRPIITGADQILNLAVGTPINEGSNFVSGESGSSTHTGGGAGQFAVGTPGRIGFVFEKMVGGPSYYGWLGLEIDNEGGGEIIDWAYEDVAGTPILAGDLGPVPEPGTGLFGLAVLLGAGLRRRRVAGAN